MWRRLARETSLAQALPRPPFAEIHCRHIASNPQTVWTVLMAITARDLPWTSRLMKIRGISADLDAPLTTNGPVPLEVVQEPTYAAGVRAGQPWRRKPTNGPTLSLADAAQFSEPGWLIMGTDYRLTATKHNQTELRTETRCRATSRSAALRFAPYWIGIRLFSGLIRREVLRAVAQRAEAQSSTSRPASAASSGATNDS